MKELKPLIWDSYYNEGNEWSCFTRFEKFYNITECDTLIPDQKCEYYEEYTETKYETLDAAKLACFEDYKKDVCSLFIN